jgi:hypothetical protein
MGETVEIWAEALQDLLRVCLAHELRQQVLAELTAREQAYMPFRIIGIAELMAMQFADYRGKKEVLALLIQIATRTIINNHDPPTAAALLFRDHYGRGTGSGWLCDYLDGLPGIVVDLKQCAEISDSAGPSRLCQAMVET